MKKYLSRMEMPLAYAFQRHFNNPYRLHQWIWKSLPNDPDASRDFLYRTDVMDRVLRILLLSERQPGTTDGCEWQVKSVSDGFLAHDIYRFQVRVNPTFKKSYPAADANGKSVKRRLGIFNQEMCEEWFKHKFDSIGLKLHSLELNAPQRETFSKGEGKSVTLITCDAKGVFEVTDRDKFVNGFDSGIGSAKGFGLGLIMCEPIS